jgi:septum site-determining protein MinD
MAHIISVHSFRGGTGKSNTSANLAALYAQKGFRVGVLDTDIQSPGIHVIFNLDEETVSYSLNDYLWGQCTIEQAAYDVSAAIEGETPGEIYLVPSSVNASDIARVLHDGYDVNLLSQGFRELIRAFDLEILIIDTHPGLNEETLLSIALSSAVLVVMRPDYQDYQGTGLTIEVARELDVPKMMILVNKVPLTFDAEQIRQMVEETYGCPVAAIIPHSDDMMTLASQGIFSTRYPEHSITVELQQVADALIR